MPRMCGEEDMRKFKKGDKLVSKTTLHFRPVAEVTNVTKEGVVHCKNLVACSTMDVGNEFNFMPDERTRYVLFEGN